MGTRQREGEVGKAAGSGVRAIWEKEGRKETLLLIASHAGLFTWFISKAMTVVVYLGRNSSEGTVATVESSAEACSVSVWSMSQACALSSVP